MDALTLLKLACAAWYMSYALTSTHGPGGMFDWIREHVWHGRRVWDLDAVDTQGALVAKKGDIRYNGLLDCPVCLSIWVALILVLVPDGVIVWALAIAGGAMLLHSAAGWRFGN